MHIPEAALSPPTYGAAFAAMAPLWLIAGRRLRRLRARQVPLLAVGAAFSFVIMMFDVPTPLGTGHAIGTALLAIVLGPWAAMLMLTVVLAVQAFFFQDGGITALGANCLNLAALAAFSGSGAYWLASLGAKASARRRVVAAGLAGYVSINVAALGTALILGLQPLLAHAPDGHPLYFPYGLKLTLAAFVLPHLLIFGFLEAGVTAAAYAFLARTEPAWFAPHAEVTRAS